MKTLILSIALLMPTVMPLSAQAIKSEQFKKYDYDYQKEKMTLIFDRHLTGKFYVFYRMVPDDFTGELKKSHEIIVYNFGKHLKKGDKITRKFTLVGRYTEPHKGQGFDFAKHYEVFK